MNKSKSFSYIKFTEDAEMTEQAVYEGFCRAIKFYDCEGIRDIYNAFPEQSEKVITSDPGDENLPLLHYALWPDEEEMDEDYSEDYLDLPEREERILSIVKTLVELGADVNQSTDAFNDDWVSGDVPLTYAVYQGFISVIEYLLDQGAIAPNEDEEMEFEGVIQTDLCLAMQQALWSPNRDIRHNTDEISRGLLMMQASRYPKKEIIKLLLKYGASVDDAVGFGGTTSTPLGDIVLDNDKEMLNFFIEELGANVSAIQNENEENILHLLFFKDHDFINEVVDLLLENGGNPQKPNKWGWNPIFLATIKRSEKALQKLLQHEGLLENSQDAMEIGSRLVKQCLLKNYPVPGKNLDYLEKIITEDFLSYLFDQHKYDLLDILFDCWENCDNFPDELELTNMFFIYLEDKKYKPAAYLMTRGWGGSMPFDNILPLLNKSLNFNSIRNFYQMLKYCISLHEDIGQSNCGEITVSAWLNKLKVYIPALNTTLFNSMKKEIDHIKLSIQFDLFKKIYERFEKLEKIFKEGHYETSFTDEMGYVKEKFAEGIQLIHEVNPSNFYAFFMRNKGRDFSKDKQEQDNINTSQDINTSCPVYNILSFLPFPDAAKISILGKFDDFVDPERVKGLKYNSGGEPIAKKARDSKDCQEGLENPSQSLSAEEIINQDVDQNDNGSLMGELAKTMNDS